MTHDHVLVKRRARLIGWTLLALVLSHLVANRNHGEPPRRHSGVVDGVFGPLTLGLTTGPCRYCSHPELLHPSALAGRHPFTPHRKEHP